MLIMDSEKCHLETEVETKEEKSITNNVESHCPAAADKIQAKVEVASTFMKMNLNFNRLEVVMLRKTSSKTSEEATEGRIIEMN